ncbi:MAG TPA: gliding motility-associated ABC transporter substrate-binding protein GldG [Sphingobacteriaceae bacterium]|nr:gliding motility-associated ABC transporter substrate-binding protein GldG [Sphingobacteriaceae bacterium]
MVDRRKKDLIYLIGFIAGIIVLNVLSSFVFTRLDFTKEKRYTLSNVTKNILLGLKDDIQVTVYLEGDFPAGFKRLRNSTRDMLTDFKAYSGGKFRFDFVNPASGSLSQQEKVFEELSQKGITPTNLSVKTDGGMSQKLVVPAALISYGGRQLPVYLLQNRQGASPEEVLNNSIQNLEYAFASAIKKISSDGIQRIGFSEGHGELTDLQLTDAMKSLQDVYEVGRVDLRIIPLSNLDKLKVLVITKPTSEFTESEKYKIDYFLMRGGRIIWAIDNVNAELDSLQGMTGQLAFPKKLNLDDMLFRYGVRINYDLIADMNCAQIPISVGNVGGQSQIQMLPWLFYPIFVPVSSHPLIKNLDGVRSEFANTVDVITVKGIKHHILFSSSPYSRKIAAPTMLSLQMVEQEPDPKQFKSEPKPVAVLLEGIFPSNFKNRPVPAGITQQVVIPEVSKATKMIVIGDGDIFKNQISSADGSTFPLGYDRYTQQQYGNKNFLLNAADYLSDDSGIITLRNKEIRIRLLDRARIRNEKSFWQFLNIGAPLIMLIVFGIFQHYYRRRKYTA